MLYETFTFGGLENYMLSVRKMCEEEGMKCFLVSVQKCDRIGVHYLSEKEFSSIRFPIYVYSLGRVLRALRPSLVHSQSYYSLALSSLLKTALHYKTICTIHNPLSVTEKDGYVRRLLPRLLSPDVITGVSRYSLEESLNRFRIRAKEKSVIYNWIDTDRFSLVDRKNPHQILFAGRLDQQKRIDMLPFLIRNLRRELPELVLHVCGDGPLTGMIEDVEGIVYHGRVDSDSLVRLIQESALLVLPSRFEGMPLVILESLACGTPVIASPVGGIPEIAEISYGCFLAGNDEFAEKVKKILGEEIDHNRIRDEAVGNFSYQRGKKELTDIYRRLLESP